MDIQEIVEILDTDIKDIGNLKGLFLDNLKYIQYVESQNFAIKNPKFSNLIEKLISAVKYHYLNLYSQIFTIEILEKKGIFGTQKKGIIQAKVLTISEKLSQCIGKLNSMSNTQPSLTVLLGLRGIIQTQCDNLLGELEDNILSAYSKVESIREDQSFFPEIYNPDKADISSAEKLIKKAIETIQKDINLPSKVQTTIIKHLEKALQALKRGNNASFFGLVQEVNIALRVVSPISDGCEAIAQIVQETLEEAVEIVENTSTTSNQLFLPNIISQNAALVEKENSSKSLPPGNSENLAEDQ